MVVDLVELVSSGSKISMSQLDDWLSQGINEFRVCRDVAWKIKSIIVKEKKKEVYLDVLEYWLNEIESSQYETFILEYEWDNFFYIDEEFRQQKDC